MINARFFKFVLGFFAIIALSGLLIVVVIPMIEGPSPVEVDDEDLTADGHIELCDPTQEKC